MKGRGWIALLSSVLSCGLLGIAAWRTPLPAAPRVQATLVRVEDRAGRPLARVVRGDLAILPVELDDLDPHLVQATLAAEDRRFFRHPGIDPLAVLRAALQNLRARRVVSGGSTLTQQLVKLRLGGAPGKPREAWLALALELRDSKRAILEEYLNRAPYGPRLRGAGAAAWSYFGHDAGRLSVAEAALLACLPQAPARLDPRRHPEAALAARNRVLARMDLPDSSLRAFAALPLGLAPPAAAGDSPAPHWIRAATERWTDAARIRLPLDPRIQAAADSALRTTLAELRARGADDGAVLVLETKSGLVRAWVGSPDWRDPDHGQVDAVTALRQPGSALKPFAYSLAFESGQRPASLLPDLPQSFMGRDGIFTPGNYAGDWHGMVRARQALANSWNAPAVALLERVGVEPFLTRLRALGITSLDAPASRYGLGLILGVGEVSLLELSGAYLTLARGGERVPIRQCLSAVDGAGLELLPSPPRDPERVIAEQAAFFTNAILSDPRARAEAFGRGEPFEFPFPVAIKTGTSSDWRDNWAFGWNDRWTAGVWIGRARGGAMDRVSGTTGAVLALRRVLLALPEEAEERSWPEPPPSVEPRSICPRTGRAAGPACPGRIDEWFAHTDPPLPTCTGHDVARLAPRVAKGCEIVRPEQGSIYTLDPSLPRAQQALLLEAATAADSLSWSVDGTWRRRVASGERIFWPLRPGRHRIRAEAAGGHDEVVIVVEGDVSEGRER